jgi:AP-5 complex subunit beta-1
MLVDKLLLCEAHTIVGEHLLQVLNEDLLRQVAPDEHLPAYFLLLERIAENGSIPPGSIVDLLMAYSRNQVLASGIQASGIQASGLWMRGSQVLLICRTIMVHHYSSRAFHSLSALLAFLAVYFPEIEVQDSAR